MVHPILRGESDLSDVEQMRYQDHDHDQSLVSETVVAASKPMIAMFPRLHVIVVGPGLGRSQNLPIRLVEQALTGARDRGMPAVIDADALGQIVAEDKKYVDGWRECVLTPNVRELENLAEAHGVTDASLATSRKWAGWDADRQRRERCEVLARDKFGGAAILSKGRVDYITDGATTLACESPGAAKRSGGQGDTLSGVLGALLAWRKGYKDQLWPHDGSLLPRDGAGDQTVLLCAYAASVIARECSRLAFAEMGRSLQASDLTDKVHQAFLNVLGEPEEHANE
jgi:ATP-dependent NAD(P)H-hydrate dehydratase